MSLAPSPAAPRVEFTRNGRTFSGPVIGRGFFEVDGPECLQVRALPHLLVLVPVSEARAVSQ